MRVLTATEMRAAEKAAVQAGSSYSQLMENAGAAAAEQMELLAADIGLPHTALFLCGKGNNAGDAFVAARLLQGRGWHCRVLPLCGLQFSPLAGNNWLALPPGVEKAELDSTPFTAAFLVDGVFGTGFKGGLPTEVQQAFKKANGAQGLRIALDIPSGMNCDTGVVSPGTFQATHTLTFGAYKPGLIMRGNAAYTGRVHCLDIGL